MMDSAIQTPDANTATLPPPASEVGIEGRTIMVVDDKENVRAMLRDILESHGLKVVLANDGLTALVGIRQACPDLILSDINMSGLDGFELLEHVRKDPSTAQVPFVLMTGKADLNGMRTGMSLGADDYLPKPFSMAELIKVIRRRFERHSALSSEAEKRMTALRNNISMMLPHELLTPLNGIVGVAALLQDDEIPHDELPQLGLMLQESGERLHHLVLNFLTLARLELFAHDPTRSTRPVQESCSTGDEWLPSLAADVAIRWDRLEDLWLSLTPVRVAMSQQDLSKIISELLDNAFKFSDRSSRVSLICQVVENQAQFIVRDSGRGMKNEHVEEIGAFQQFDRKLHEQQGTGLGLIIAKRMVEFHRGKFSVESDVDVGTSITFTLPQRRS